MSVGAAGQSPAPAPELSRPRLESSQDSNAAGSYIALSRRLLLRQPVDLARAKDARSAAYWATRLDPTSARALLLYWQATWLSNVDLARALDRGDRKAMESPEVARIDTLYWRAMLRDPFALADPAIERWVEPSEAVVLEAIRKDSNNVGLRLFEASRRYRRAEYDSAVFFVRGALAIVERLEEKRTGRIYQSREIFHYAIGKALYESGDRNAAREEFGAALSEDLSFYPAHAALATIAWSNWSDLETARREYEMAIELHGDAIVHYDYGTILLDAKHYDEAIPEFDAAIAGEPYFAYPYFNRAIALDRVGRTAEAAAGFRAFLDRAPRELSAAIDQARRRLAALSSPGDSPKP
jgi:tetratricopeptide (TPR) repeat protein